MQFASLIQSSIIEPLLRLRFSLHAVPAALLACLLTACGLPLGGKDASRLQGLIIDQQLNEISGIAASKRFKDVFWVIDDGGNAPNLYAIDAYGIRKATVTVDVQKTDWEDISTVDLNGTSYLVVADIGDNGGLRKTLQLHLIEEPHTLANERVRPFRSIAFKYPDGPHDAEALSVDNRTKQAILVTKKRKPPMVFSIPVNAASDNVVTAKRLGDAHHVPAATEQELRDRPRLAPHDHQVTAASIAPDRRSIALMTYRYLLIYPRAQDESWSQALRNEPVIRVLPIIPQAEAMTYTRDGGSVMVTGEFSIAPFYRIPVGRHGG